MVQQVHSLIPCFSQGLGFTTSAKSGNARKIFRSSTKHLMILVI